MTFGPGFEDPVHLGVDHQVQVALAISGLDIAKAVVFLRQRPQGFGQEYETLNLQGELVGPGAEQRATHPDNIAQVDKTLEAIEGLLPHHLLLKINLDTAGPFLDMGETGLAELPEEHQAASQFKALLQQL